MVETIQSTDLRRRVRDVLDRVRIKREPVIVQNYGTPQAVIIPYEDFEAYREWQDNRAERLVWLAELRAIAEEVSARTEDKVEETDQPTSRNSAESELRPEYNSPQLLKDGIRGKYATEYQKAVDTEMNKSVIPTVVEQMLILPDDAQRKVLAFLKTLRTTTQRGTPGKQLLQFAGLVQSGELALMQQAIESNCEQVDTNAW
jgi:prevent-host-death family protein